MLTDGRTDGQKIGRLYRTLLQAGAIKMNANYAEICRVGNLQADFQLVLLVQSV